MRGLLYYLVILFVGLALPLPSHATETPPWLTGFRNLHRVVHDTQPSNAGICIGTLAALYHAIRTRGGDQYADERETETEAKAMLHRIITHLGILDAGGTLDASDPGKQYRALLLAWLENTEKILGCAQNHGEVRHSATAHSFKDERLTVWLRVLLSNFEAGRSDPLRASLSRHIRKLSWIPYVNIGVAALILPLRWTKFSSLVLPTYFSLAAINFFIASRSRRLQRIQQDYSSAGASLEGFLEKIPAANPNKAQSFFWISDSFILSHLSWRKLTAGAVTEADIAGMQADYLKRLSRRENSNGLLAPDETSVQFRVVLETNLNGPARLTVIVVKGEPINSRGDSDPRARPPRWGLNIFAPAGAK